MARIGQMNEEKTGEERGWAPPKRGYILPHMYSFALSAVKSTKSCQPWTGGARNAVKEGLSSMNEPPNGKYYTEKLEGRQISMPLGRIQDLGNGKRQPPLRNAVSRVHTQSAIGLGFAGRLEPGYGRDLSPATVLHNRYTVRTLPFGTVMACNVKSGPVMHI